MRSVVEHRLGRMSNEALDVRRRKAFKVSSHSSYNAERRSLEVRCGISSKKSGRPAKTLTYSEKRHLIKKRGVAPRRRSLEVRSGISSKREWSPREDAGLRRESPFAHNSPELTVALREVELTVEYRKTLSLALRCVLELLDDRRIDFTKQSLYSLQTEKKNKSIHVPV